MGHCSRCAVLKPAALPPDGCHLNDPAVGVNGDGRDDTAVWEEDMIERTVSVDQDLFAPTANVLKLWHELLEIAGRQGKQEAIAGPIRRGVHTSLGSLPWSFRRPRVRFL
jgi:hypothetical protein